jgi:hypothetical protein
MTLFEIFRTLLASCFVLVSCLADSSTLKMMTCSSETSVDFQRITRHYMPETELVFSPVPCHGDRGYYGRLQIAFYSCNQQCNIWNLCKGCSLQPPAHAGSSLADFYTLKMETIRSSETSVYTISTRRYIPEAGILHSHRRENLKSYEKN